MSDQLVKLLAEIETLPEFSGRHVDVNSQGIFGNYPIHAVCTWGDQAALELLLHAGADINSVGEGDETPVFRAARVGHEDLTAFLLKRGARADVKNANGHYPHEVAARCGQVNVAKLLSDCLPQ